jgi:hypothetical protein
VLSWVWDAMGQDQKQSLENAVQTQINNQINPPVVILPLPWSPPLIVTQPENVTTTTGSSVTFTITTSGKPTPTCQWYKDNVAIEGATSTEYTIQNVTESDFTYYTVTITNIYGSATSRKAYVIKDIPVPPLPIPPSITLQPTNQTVVVGDGVAFNVNATGDEPLSYQWFKDNTEITGGTGNTLIIQTVALTDAGQYKATVTNAVGTIVSDTVTLTVTE